MVNTLEADDLVTSRATCTGESAVTSSAAAAAAAEVALCLRRRLLRKFIAAL